MIELFAGKGENGANFFVMLFKSDGLIERAAVQCHDLLCTFLFSHDVSNLDGLLMPDNSCLMLLPTIKRLHVSRESKSDTISESV